MSETDSETPKRGMEDPLREMFRKANISFIMPGAPAREAAAPEAEPTQEDPKRRERLKAIREFALKPREIRDYLDRFVIGQDEAKRVLSVAICDHYNYVRRCLADPAAAEQEHSKHNVILLGPTGVGKTYLVKCISRLVQVPFVKADATKFSETGYVGHDVEDLVRDLVKAADGDVELAQFGIIYLDEVDKIATETTTVGRDVSGRGVQINLLKLMEETEVSPFSQTDLLGQMQAIFDMQRGRSGARRTINTRHILFIVSGAFEKLADLVRKRVKSSRIGFGPSAETERESGEYLRLATTKDFMDYGFEPEFIGRLPVRVVCDHLTAKDLERILRHAEGNVLEQYRADFRGYGIECTATPEALTAIAETAGAEKTGARGLMTVLERVFRNYKFELPSTSVRSLELTRQMVEKPEDHLQDLLRRQETERRDVLRQEVKRFGEEFGRQHGIRLVFTRPATEEIVALCEKEGKTVRAVWTERYGDVGYGLDLMARNTAKKAFRVTPRFLANPARELSRRITRSFGQNG